MSDLTWLNTFFHFFSPRPIFPPKELEKLRLAVLQRGWQSKCRPQDPHFPFLDVACMRCASYRSRCLHRPQRPQGHRTIRAHPISHPRSRRICPVYRCFVFFECDGDRRPRPITSVLQRLNTRAQRLNTATQQLNTGLQRLNSPLQLLNTGPQRPITRAQPPSTGRRPPIARPQQSTAVRQ